MLFAGDLPRTVVAVTVWTYWLCVVGMVVRNHWRFGRPAGSLPRTPRERWMWAAWLPAILLWQVLPTLSATATHPLLAVPGPAVDNLMWVTVRGLAAALAVATVVLTVPCWLRMGKDWSMAIVPGKRRRLITSGMFSYVRHPIYALSILLMIATMVIVPAPAMWVVGGIHIAMLYTKAVYEEQYLRGTHGEKYADYCAGTGRFLPRRPRATSVDDADQHSRAA